MNFDHEDSGMTLTTFHSRTNLKLHNISMTHKMFKKVILNLDVSEASGLADLEIWQK